MKPSHATPQQRKSRAEQFVDLFTGSISTTYREENVAAALVALIRVGMLDFQGVSSLLHLRDRDPIVEVEMLDDTDAIMHRIREGWRFLGAGLNKEQQLVGMLARPRSVSAPDEEPPR